MQATTDKIRVLIVDDSAIVRKLLSEILGADPKIEIVGLAANGKIGVQMFENLKPDLVTMDIEMPEMTGLEALSKIRETDKRTPVLMFSSLTQRGAADTLDALGRGATDYVTKPTNEAGGLNAAKEWIRDQVLAKIHALGARTKLFNMASKAPTTPSVTTLASSASKPNALFKVTNRVEIVTIGISTGGPNALMELIPKIPAGFPVPIVIVQHMPASFTKFLADRLNTTSPLNVREAGNDKPVLKAGDVWIAPGGFHMVLEKDGALVRLALNDEAPENSCRPAVDVLFRSVSQIYGKGTLGLVMTGMGYDGLKGSEVIVKNGGQVFTQDEASSVVWGMPGAVTNAGLSSRVLPLKDIAKAIIETVGEQRIGFTYEQRQL
ncbi:chemotaxis response regulator protein-glutamate methylesterase [bacterium]|nr:chemotaxis response regulator protein-glutamate methylesterase [bacterium]